ncbi:hypothetical protein [Marinobacter sp. C2H3]|uniref:hypothetical protein n=1 Tax=Marinobacter sp. C2H3 TaxID=3119003 RepID=UPI00300F26E3
MDTLFSTVLLAGPALFWIGVAWTFYRLVRQSSQEDGFAVAFRHAFVSLGLGLMAYLPLALAGAWAFCSASAENLCGLGGYVGLGPAAMGLVLIARARRTGRRSSSRPS